MYGFMEVMMNKNKLLLYSLVFTFCASAMDDLNYKRLMHMGKNRSPEVYQQAIQQSGKTPATIIGNALRTKKEYAIQELKDRFEQEQGWAQVMPVNWERVHELSGQTLESVIAQYQKPGDSISYEFCHDFDPTAQNAINTAVKEVVQDNNALPVKMGVPPANYLVEVGAMDSGKDERLILFNPVLLKSYTEDELRFAFAHEVGHLWLQHDQLKGQFVPSGLRADARGTVEQKHAIAQQISQSAEFNRLSRVCELEADSCAALCHDNACINVTRDEGVQTETASTPHTHPSFEKRKQWAMCIEGLKEVRQKNK